MKYTVLVVSIAAAIVALIAFRRPAASHAHSVESYSPPTWLQEAMERMDSYVVGRNPDLDVNRIWEQSDPTPLEPEQHAIVVEGLARKLEACAELLAKAEDGGLVDANTGAAADPLPLRFALMECEHQLAEFLAGRYRRSDFAAVPFRLRAAQTLSARLSECLVPELQTLLLFRIEQADHPNMFALKNELLSRAEKPARR